MKCFRGFAVLAVASFVAPILGRAQPSENTGPVRSVEVVFHEAHKWDYSNGDTWDLAWADDGKLYSFNCDGKGFGDSLRNIGVNCLTGPSVTELTGTQINSMDPYSEEMKPPTKRGPDGATWKGTGIESVDGTLYGFICRNVYGNESKDPLMRQTSYNASLIKSTDKGLTWTPDADHNYHQPMWPGGRFGNPCFVRMGRDGAGGTQDGADKYVYAVSNNGFWNNGDDMIIGRVARADIGKLRASDWTYLAGADGAKDADWTGDLGKARSILDLPARIGGNSPCYIPALKCYLFISWYVKGPLPHWFTPHTMEYAFYQGPHPWGPWTYINTVSDSFLTGDWHMYGPNICTRFQQVSGDDVKVFMFTSGCPYQGAPDGLYKLWEMPLLLHTHPDYPSHVVDHAEPRINYSGGWLTHRLFSDPREDHLHYCGNAGDSAGINFNGSGFDWIADMAGDLGTAKVYIDGQLKESVSLAKKNFPRFQQVPVYSVRGLAPGPHTVTIENEGQGIIDVSGFRIYNSSRP